MEFLDEDEASMGPRRMAVDDPSNGPRSASTITRLQWGHGAWPWMTLEIFIA